MFKIRITNFYSQKICGSNDQIISKIDAGSNCCQQLTYFLVKNFVDSNFFIYNAQNSKRIIFESNNYNDALKEFSKLTDTLQKKLIEKYNNITHLSNCEIVLKIGKL